MSLALLAPPAPVDFPPCPVWCAGDCAPGPFTNDDGFTFDRYPNHSTVLAEVVTVDNYQLQAFVERSDLSVDDVEYEIGLRFVNLSEPLINGLVNATFFRLSRAQRYALAVALLRANEIETTT